MKLHHITADIADHAINDDFHIQATVEKPALFIHLQSVADQYVKTTVNAIVEYRKLALSNQAFYVASYECQLKETANIATLEITDQCIKSLFPNVETDVGCIHKFDADMIVSLANALHAKGYDGAFVTDKMNMPNQTVEIKQGNVNIVMHNATAMQNVLNVLVFNEGIIETAKYVKHESV